MRPMILVAEDDAAYAGAIREGLTEAGYEVELASNGRTAISLAAVKPFGLVVTDLKMPEASGFQVLHGVRKIRADLPVVLMTGYAAETSAEEARSVGAAGFLEKPFRLPELLELVGKLLPSGLPSPEDAEEKSPEEFCPVSIGEFISGKTVSVDLYIRLGDGKYVRIANAGETLPIERLQTYRRHDVEFLYLPRREYEKYVCLQLKLARAVGQGGPLPISRKLQFMRHAGETVLQHLFFEGINKRSFEHAKALTSANLAIVSQNESLGDVLEALNRHVDHVFAHSLGVSVYAIMLARALGWRSPVTLFKVSLAGLLHDIGLKELPRPLLDKPRRAYSVSESRLFERHPLMGVDLLRGIREIPTEVMLVVAQHHENRTGTGYPAGMRDSQLFPLAKLIAVADEFCELTIRSPASEPMPPEEALRFLKGVKRCFLDAHMLEALEGLFRRIS